MSKTLSILATCLLTCWATYAQAITPENIQNGGKYYFYNVGSGRWLAAGNSWSTRASLLTHAEYQILHQQPSGKYTLESQVGGSQSSQWLGANLFLDTSNPIELTIAESGSHSTIACGDSILGYDGSTTELYHAATGNNALWDIYSEEEMLQRLRQATSTSPVDATFLILDPNFGRYNVNQSAWTIEASNHNLSGGSETNRCAESWHSIFTLSQTLSNAPAGIYKLVAQGFYRQDDASENPLLPYFYANNAKVTFPQISGTENSMADASASFTNGLYTSSPIYVEVTEGEELTIGARNEESLNLWCIWDNFELTYYGTDGDINDFTGTLPKENWQQAHAAAEAALADSTYDNVMGSERFNLRAELDKAEPTDNEGYTSATEALKTATQAFIDAAPAYDGIMAEIIQALNVGLNTREAELLIGSSTTTAADIIAATQDLKLQEYQTVNAQYTYNASHVLGRWESTYSRLAGQDYADDGHTYYDIWSSDSTTPTATQTLTLPAGNYVFKVLGRGQVGASQQMRVATPYYTYTRPFIMAGDTGLGTNKAGVTSFEPNDAEGFAYDGAGRGWQWRYIAFQMAEAGEVTFTVTGHIQSQWISWDAPTLLSDAEIVLPTYITFADPAVESICLNRWDSDHDGLLNFREAEEVTSLGNAFTDNASITSFTELKYFTSLEDLGDETFRNCQSLDTLTLPRNLWRIGRRAFAGCTALRGVTIPANVVSLGYHAFSGCTKLKTVVSNILCPQPISSTVFEDIAPDATLYVQTETGYHYQEAAGWNSFANINASVYSEWYWPEDDYQTVMHFVNTDSTIVTLEKRINESDFIVNPDNTMFFRTEYALGLRKGDMKHTMALADDLYTGSFSNLWMVPCAVLDRTKQEFFIFASSKQPANNYAESGHAFRINLNDYERTRETVFTDTNWGWHSYFDCTDVEAPVVKHFSSAGYYTVVSTRNGDGTWNNETTEQIMPDEFTQQSIRRPQLLILDTLNIETETDAEPVENIVFADTIVKRICVENWDTNGDGELSKDEAAAVTDLGEAFTGNQQITFFDELQYFTGLTSIGFAAFNSCSFLSSFIIPTSVTTIGTSSFTYCRISNLTIPNSVTTIGDYAFSTCFELTSINIPASVTSIGVNPFDYCVNLESITVESDNTAYNDGNGSNCIIETATNKLVTGCKNTTLPSNITSIGANAYYGCTGLTSMTIPSSVTSIEEDAFRICYNMTSVSIPASVTSIGERAFYWCDGLTEVHSEITEPFAISRNTFEGIDSLATLYVPYPTAEKYRATEGWPDHFANIVEVGTPEPTGEPIAFADAEVQRICLQNWDINGDGLLLTGEAELVTDLGNAFTGNTSITSFDELQHFTGLQTIGANAFEGCASLRSITIPANVQQLGQNAFTGTTSLITIDWQGQLPLTTQTLAQAGIESRSDNQLMYVTGGTPVELGSDFAAQWIVDGGTEELTLTDGEPLLVTRPFHAEKATYSRTFSKESGRGESAGWETLALPFDVQRIESLTKGELQPFGAVGGMAHPFWLRQWTGEDFRSATAIKANTPYIISMPNNKMYYEEYNVKGRVRFMAEDVDILPMDTNTQQGAFHYTYLPVAAAPEVYALNNDTYETQDHKMFRPGGVFVSDLRGVRPFEAYFDIAESAGGREYIPILLDDATHIDELVDGTASTLDLRSAIVYDLQGRRVNGQRSMVNGQQSTVNGQLKKGLYILHSGNGSLRGKKQLVK